MQDLSGVVLADALGRPATNSTRDRARILKRVDEIEAVAQAAGYRIKIERIDSPLTPEAQAQQTF